MNSCVCVYLILAAYIEQIEDGFLLQYAALHLGGQLSLKNISYINQ